MTTEIDNKRKPKKMDDLENTFSKKLKIIEEDFVTIEEVDDIDDTNESTGKRKNIFQKETAKKRGLGHINNPPKKRANQIQKKGDRITELENRVKELERDVTLLKSLFQVRAIESGSERFGTKSILKKDNTISVGHDSQKKVRFDETNSYDNENFYWDKVVT